MENSYLSQFSGVVVKNKQSDEHGPKKSRLTVSAMSDADLLVRLRRRDMEAFESLYKEYWPRLSHFLTGMVHKPQIVEEVFDDTMMVVWEKIDNFAGDSKLITWVYAIAYRKALKAKAKIDEPVEEKNARESIYGADCPEKDLSNATLRRVIGQGLEKLSPDHRTVIDLAYFHGMKYHEIAQIMDCPVDTVKTRMFHARRNLKQSLGGNFADWV